MLLLWVLHLELEGVLVLFSDPVLIAFAMLMEEEFMPSLLA
jgi:hypothetical protein